MPRSRGELEVCLVAAAMPCWESAGISQPDSSGGIILAVVWLPSFFFFLLEDIKFDLIFKDQHHCVL